MDILLIRHGQAVDEAPGLGDAGRWLTAKGRKVTRKVARWLDEKDARRPTSFWTSPLVRAVQTAEVVAAETRFKGEILARPQLSPGHDPGDLLKLLAAEPVEGPLALVGHEPSLSLIAGALLGDTGVAELKKSGVMAIAWDAATGGPGKVRFVFDPILMKSEKRPKPAVPPEPRSEG
jgi:phosphohistidine phosphatase